MEVFEAPLREKNNPGSEQDVASNPLALFKKWFHVASCTEEILEPNTMYLGTATPNGNPSVRAMLLKVVSYNPAS